MDVAIWGRGVGGEVFILEGGAKWRIIASQTTCFFFPSCLHTFAQGGPYSWNVFPFCPLPLAPLITSTWYAQLSSGSLYPWVSHHHTPEAVAFASVLASEALVKLQEYLLMGLCYGLDVCVPPPNSC